MKMPEPIGYEYGNSVWYETNPRITDHIRKHGKPLYDKQALIDLLEAAAVECESRKTPNTGSVAILNGAADAIRAMKEKL